MNAAAKNARLWLIAQHCRAHGTVTTRSEGVFPAGYNANQAGNVLTRMHRDGWLERIEPGVYRLSAKGLAWEGPVCERLVKMCEEAATTAQYAAWQLGLSYSRVRWLLGHLERQRRIRRIEPGLYGRRLEVVSVAAE